MKTRQNKISQKSWNQKLMWTEVPWRSKEIQQLACSNSFLKIFFIITYFPQLHLECYPKSPPYPSPPLPYPPIPIFWPWHSPVLGHLKFASPMGLSFQWWPTRPSFDTYAARDKSSGVLLSSYCCSTYRVAVPFSSLGAFSSSSIGGPVVHSIADCEHPLLCLLGPGIVSQERAITGSFQRNLASVCNGVSIWRLIMGFSLSYINMYIFIIICIWVLYSCETILTQNICKNSHE